jgi:hypothetical protein
LPIDLDERGVDRDGGDGNGSVSRSGNRVCSIRLSSYICKGDGPEGEAVAGGAIASDSGKAGGSGERETGLCPVGQTGVATCQRAVGLDMI